MLPAGRTKSVQKIKLGFLMVGHTHEDVYQFFSRFSKRLTWNPAKTVPSLMDELERCYNPKPTAFSLDRIYKIKEWLSPCISIISFHAGPHQFKIELNKDDKAVVVYKKWSTDSVWESCDGLNDGILINNLPEGKPEVQCFDEKKMASLDIDRLKNDYTSQAAAFMSPDENKWWKNFFQDIEKLAGILRQFCNVM